jgi:hypothetical protein
MQTLILPDTGARQELLRFKREKPVQQLISGGKMLSQIQAPITSMALIFKEGEVYLSNTEAKILKVWITGWAALRGRKLITIGGAHETSRTGRLRRVNSLLQIFWQLGIKPKYVRPAEDLTQPSRMGSMDDLPADVVWLPLTLAQ